MSYHRRQTPNTDVRSMTKTTPQHSDEEGFCILDQLEDILNHDPLIDELGYIHPSQLLMLNEEAGAASEVSGVVGVEGKNAFFWNRDHKLGISTSCLLLLYKAAKHRFMNAFVTYKTFDLSLKNDNVLKSSTLSEIEHEVMKHSKALLLLSSDFSTAWNASAAIGSCDAAIQLSILSLTPFFFVFCFLFLSFHQCRKLILSKSGEFSISNELLLSTLILSFAPKSENAWSYRRWVIKRGAGWCATEELLEKESKLVEKIVEKSKMNYRAWNHRCWLISYMTSQQVVHELSAIRQWASLHVADSSCFHYRRKLLLRMLGNTSDGKDMVACSSLSKSLGLMWKDELEWNEVLIRRYIGREALWLHRRFLSVCWVKNFGADQHCVLQNLSVEENANNIVSVFMDRELGLLQDCLNMPDSEFEDVQSQAIHSAAYILYVYREISCLSNVNLNLNQKLGASDLMKLLNRLCPEKTKVWDSLMPNL